MKPLQATSLLEVGVKKSANHTWRETAGSWAKDNSNNKDNNNKLTRSVLIHFLLPFSWQLEPRALPHSQFSLSLFQVHALWQVVRGKSFKERKKKKSLNHGRDSAVLLVWQVLWAQSNVERRRRGQKLTFYAHLYTSLVPRTVYGELNASFWILSGFLLRKALYLIRVFATFRYTLARAIPWNLAAVWLQDGFNDSSTPEVFQTHVALL